MPDTTARDAIERSVAARLLICDEVELRAIDRMLVGIEKRRELAVFHVERTGEFSRADALAMLRDSSTERSR